MHLIIIYGPPGVGKLTVARELTTPTGFKVFHNHLTNDLVTSLFEFGSEPMLRLTTKYRIEMLTEAAKAGLPGVIHTFVYSRGVDDDFMQDLIDAAEDNGGTTTLVLLRCDPEVLLERLVSESRGEFGKLRDTDTLRRMLKRHALMEPFPLRPSLVIDNTHLAPGDVADRIANELAPCP
jgi:tRNA uridine 5-carbamoylmethylation protein Kti12